MLDRAQPASQSPHHGKGAPLSSPSILVSLWLLFSFGLAGCLCRAINMIKFETRPLWHLISNEGKNLQGLHSPISFFCLFLGYFPPPHRMKSHSCDGVPVSLLTRSSLSTGDPALRSHRNPLRSDAGICPSSNQSRPFSSQAHPPALTSCFSWCLPASCSAGSLLQTCVQSTHLPSLATARQVTCSADSVLNSL